MGSVGCLLHHGSNRFRGAACIGVCGVCMCTCVRAHSRGRRPGISDPTVLQNPPRELCLGCLGSLAAAPADIQTWKQEQVESSSQALRVVPKGLWW